MGNHNNCCNEHHHHHHHNNDGKWDEIFMILSALLVVVGLLFEKNMSFSFFHIGVFVIAYFLAGGSVIINSVKGILKGKIFDENFLMSIASLGAIIIGEYVEGIAVMLLYKIGEALQHNAVDKSRKSISALLDLNPEYANLKKENDYIKVSPQSVKIGDIILVKPGERVPLDGVIIKGTSSFDTSAITGEAMPKAVQYKDEAISGYINLSGGVEIKVTGEYKNSTVKKIIDMAENASEKKAKAEKFITRFSVRYTPIVTIIAFIIAFVIPIFIGDFKSWIYKGLVFLVMSCPCALVISIPLTFFGGIGRASKLGILVKGGNTFDALSEAKTVIFDKTGTLTNGKFKVSIIYSEIKKEELLKNSALAESMSNHPLANAIIEKYGKDIEKEKIQDFKEIPGKGIIASFEGQKIIAGNKALLQEENITYKEAENEGTCVYVALDGKFLGYIVFSDLVKEGSIGISEKLKKIGINKTVMLSGDKKEACINVGKEAGIDKIFSSLTPQDKVKYVEEEKDKGKVIFVGDGINDTPAIAAADTGIAMGKGSMAASQMADVVIMGENPEKLILAIKIARKTLKTAKENIIFALGVKVLMLVLGIFGVAGMWTGVFADVGVCLIAILNSLKILKYGK
ncbi:MAG: cadmium-translocating P-type ATPase [Clostridia bacterium]|nr:cadmium-translocating P-type ATPase [Clostridia bacterium]